ncbi:MAG TPA: hypothetical protein VI749_07735 [Candidatus Omnitrophota bacterium]|nr:hypothetical protein [Candidatus Omnitrophota bacterium]
MTFDKDFFISQKFTQAQLGKYRKSAKRNLDIAGRHGEPEVVFHFSYMALIMIGIYYLAKEGYRVKSRPGHHKKIIEALSEILGSQDVLVVGERMRKSRNRDMYNADMLIAKKEASEYLQFVEGLFKAL